MLDNSMSQTWGRFILVFGVVKTKCLVSCCASDEADEVPGEVMCHSAGERFCLTLLTCPITKSRRPFVALMVFHLVKSNQRSFPPAAEKRQIEFT